MSVGSRFGNNGLVQTDGQSGLDVGNNPSNVGFSPYALNTNNTTGAPSAGAFDANTPGFYWVSGSFTTTGTLPNPAAHPGSFWTFSNSATGSNLTSEFLLTSSIGQGVTNVFVHNGVGVGGVTGSTGGNVGGPAQQTVYFDTPGPRVGTKLRVSRGGSVCLFSDGGKYITLASSGSLEMLA